MNLTKNVPASEIVGDRLLDRAAMAEVLGISPGAILVSLSRGRFPIAPLKIGSRLRWRLTDVQRYLSGAAAGDGPVAPGTPNAPSPTRRVATREAAR
jgi:predicted DNA-binding transcriptional regulator AlpA